MTSTFVWVALLLGDAGEDSAKMLRIAWASQYEWREDKIENVTLDFAYAGSWKGKREGEEAKWAGKGQVVVIGNELVRSHYPGVDDRVRGALEGQMRWVVARFARRPFEEEFKDAKFAAPEAMADGTTKIKAGDRTFLVRNDRLAGMEVDVGSAAMPYIARLDWTTGDAGGGYSVLAEQQVYTRAGSKWSMARTLALREGGDLPSPSASTFASSTPLGGTVEVKITFEAPVTNAADPRAGDPAARGELKGAWGRRYVLPAEGRIDGEFQRKIDRDLAKLGWTATVKGEFQIAGLEPCEVVIDEKSFRGGWRADQITQSCQQHFRWFFALLEARDFDAEFKNCGFRRSAEVIEVLGYPEALAFRLADGAIVAYRENTADEGGWWEFKLKEGKDDLVRIDGMSTRIGERDVSLRFKYQKVKGIDVPASFEVVAQGEGGGPELGFGIAEYELKKLRLSR